MKQKTVKNKTKELVEKFPHTGKQYVIPLLQKIQDADGYISEEMMDLAAEKLDVPVSRIYAVSTFYSYFRLQPVGKHLLRPCQGTACHVKGAKRIINKMKEKLELTDMDTTVDNKFTVSPVSCLGTCGLAPVMMVGDNVHGNLDEEKIGEIIDRLRK